MSTNRNYLKVRAASSFLSRGKCPTQEDYVLADREKEIFVVADGFGGSIPGAIAAKEVCEAVKDYLFKKARDMEATMPFVLKTYYSLAGNVLFNALIHANRKLIQLNKGKNINEKGGASAIAGFMDGDLLAVAQVGICRGWIFRNGKAVELTTPRSYGRLCNPFVSEVREEQNIPLMTLGTANDLEPEIIEFRVHEKDWIVLHTDGVSLEVQQKLLEISMKNLSPEAAMDEITVLMNQAEFTDNAAVSVAIL